MLDELSGRDSRVVDQAVELAEFGHRELYRGLPLRRIGHVEVDVARGLAQLGGQRGAVVIEHVGDHHLAAPRDDVPGERRAQAACAAGDDRCDIRQAIRIVLHPNNFLSGVNLARFRCRSWPQRRRSMRSNDIRRPEGAAESLVQRERIEQCRGLRAPGSLGTGEWDNGCPARPGGS